jgi:hypothetical protein
MRRPILATLGDTGNPAQVAAQREGPMIYGFANDGLAIKKPQTVYAGDGLLMLLWTVNADNGGVTTRPGNPTAPAGWTYLGKSVSGTGPSDYTSYMAIWAYYRLADGTETDRITITDNITPSPHPIMGGIIYSFSYAAGASPSNTVVANEGAAVFNSNYPMPAITAAVDDYIFYAVLTQAYATSATRQWSTETTTTYFSYQTNVIPASAELQGNANFVNAGGANEQTSHSHFGGQGWYFVPDEQEPDISMWPYHREWNGIGTMEYTFMGFFANAKVNSSQSGTLYAHTEHYDDYDYQYSSGWSLGRQLGIGVRIDRSPPA